MKKEVPHRKGNQRSRRNDVDIEARKSKRKIISDIHLHHEHQAHLMMIQMRVKVEAMRTRKAQIPDLGWVQMISTNTAYLQIWHNTPMLIHSDTYIKEADVIKTALIKNPVPENINPVKALDDFVRDIVKDKKKQKNLNFDNDLAKFQGQTRSVMGPLSNTWTAVGSAILSHEYSVEVDLKEIQ